MCTPAPRPCSCLARPAPPPPPTRTHTHTPPAGALEDAARADKLARASPPTPSSSGGGEQQLAVTAAAWAAVQRCADPATFLPQLSDRFFKLACQCAGRYRSWLGEVDTARRAAVAAAAAAAPAAPGAAPAPGLGAGAAPGVPGAGSAAGLGPAAWVAAASLEDLCLVVADAQRLGGRVGGEFAGQVQRLLAAQLPPGEGAGATSVAAEALLTSGEAVAARAQQVRPSNTRAHCALHTLGSSKQLAPATLRVSAFHPLHTPAQAHVLGQLLNAHPPAHTHVLAAAGVPCL